MYSGFITSKRVSNKIGVHQRFNSAAYKMVADFLRPGHFPNLKDIHHFEGVNGPDGLKAKIGKVGMPHNCSEHDDPSHMYDPVSDEGVLPQLIQAHYSSLVRALAARDQIRSAFEASWLAHYLSDGLTPAHHFPYDEKKEELFGHKSEVGLLKKHWGWWGVKGVLSQHLHFEFGVAATLLATRLKFALDPAALALARQIGVVEYFRREAIKIAKFNLYERFYAKGWNAKFAKIIQDQVAATSVQVIGIVWLLAYLEAGYLTAVEAVESQAALVPVV